MPSTARLLDSVAPEVKMISSGAAPMSAATWARAALDRAAPRATERVRAEADCRSRRRALRHSLIACATAGSTGVVAA